VLLLSILTSLLSTVRKVISLSRVLVFSIGWIILAFIFLIFDPLALFNVFPPLLIGGSDPSQLEGVANPNNS
jgi:hypothetical protein